MIFLGLGSNQGDRRDNLRQAISRLRQNGFDVLRISPVLETPAMLGENANSDWLQPFLNCVVECSSELHPKEGLAVVKRIESDLGRTSGPKWSPRPIDIDLLIWNFECIQEPDLCIPHTGISKRSFVLTPLLHLVPGLCLPGMAENIFEMSELGDFDPLWMGIVNLTPDSFSGDGKSFDSCELEKTLDSFIQKGVQIVDFGAESTRPNAVPIDLDEEWHRLEPALKLFRDKTQGDPLAPRISVDSYHWQTIAKAVDFGIHYINDVGGLKNPKMCAIARESLCDVIVMHSLSVPANPKVKLTREESALRQVKDWIDGCAEYWINQGVDLDRIIIDPGIGFGKDALQSLELLRACKQIRNTRLRLMIGHSRKSFMKEFSGEAQNRDLETLGISLALSGNVDIFRVHDPISHMRAHLAYRHVRRVG
ncbi:MAG: dihydropteroate synthase [Gammaproteobacteria bacterium]|nr:dihydropteroate synthase [Gammaproteobacteria bacterium]